MKYAIVLITLLASFTASAAGTHECTGLDSIGYLIENPKTLGTAIKIAHVSTEEPAAAPDHLLVFVYSLPEGGSVCTAVSLNAEGHGFGNVDLSSAKTVSYDAKKGVLFSVRVALPNLLGTNKPTYQTLSIRANQATGKVTLE